ncbi:MAG: hypothetical protein A3K19_04070 [Lentisphaerae bacterium RIFOXYB12_FULL_65_16]|nr:MAG: hypothetical protein A3K18_08315 [Lentisphaerae bacterium RIFOXYA12_64_32]OGV84262.1 MAG: hypothetical protein A3K19_04070 [Lentisphaerae bacterium RIFOXYB12_FULL_65_16]
MHLSLACLSTLAVLSASLAFAQSAPPLIDLPLAGSLANRGSLGGDATLAVYAPGEAAVFDDGALGECLDFTQASRHGGVFGQDTTPAGSAVVFPGDKLAGLETFTIMLWARQNPTADGVSARLGMTESGWDWTPAVNGLSISFGSGQDKAGHTFKYKAMERAKFPPLTDWRFNAVVVDKDTVRGYLGGLGLPPVLLGEQPRTGPRPQAWGNLVIGNLLTIRPFNGWLAHFRLYDRALSGDEIAAAAAADLTAATTARPRFPQPRPDPARPLVFKRSSIPFSTRWQRPDALPVMQSFHATDCLWVYGTKKEYAAAIQAAGLRYQGTLNGLQGTDKATPDKPAAGDPSGRHEDLDGNKNMPSWMVTFKPPHYTGCCNHPAFRDLFFTAAKAHVDIGVDMLHVDDAAMNASWVRYGGVCFCEHCRAGFRDYLRKAHTPEELKALGIDAIDSFDYRQHLKDHGVPDAAAYRKQFKTLPLTPDFIAFQIESTRTFYRDFRAKLNEWSPQKYIAISVNDCIPMPAADGSHVHSDLVDFYHGEVYDRTFAASLAGNKTADALGLQFVSTPVLQGTADGARTLALSYALGQLHLVPWDIYMGSDETGSVPRYFGTREEFGALYDLIHEHPELFDTYQSVAEIAVLVNADVETSARVTRFCENLAARQIPFHLVVAATKQARIPLRDADLRTVKALVTLSPVETLAPDDRACLDRVAAENRFRLVRADADLDRFLATRDMDLLQFEGPAKVYLFPRAAPDGSVIIHVVNWNSTPDLKQPEAYTHVTVALKHPQRWGVIGKATYWQPGEAPTDLAPEPHADSVRLTLPRLATWGIVALPPPANAPTQP